MNKNLRSFLVRELSKVMESMSAEQARIFASELTIRVNNHISDVSLGLIPENTKWSQLVNFPVETWNELTIGVPWEAYSISHGSLGRKYIQSHTQAVCSAPAHLDVLLAKQAEISGLWGGSLLGALGKILESANQELLVVSPYWRTYGVKSLLSNAGRKSYEGVNVTVLTQPSYLMKTEDKEGLIYFINTLSESKAEVQVLVLADNNTQVPFMHAKLVVADGVLAYVGSANFTRSGLDHGLEAGVLVEGEVANAFASWIKVISSTCESWK